MNEKTKQAANQRTWQLAASDRSAAHMANRRHDKEHTTWRGQGEERRRGKAKGEAMDGEDDEGVLPMPKRHD